MVALTRIPPRAGLSGSLETLELDKVSTLSPRWICGEFSESFLKLSYHAYGGGPGDRPRISYPFSRRCAVVEKIAVPNLFRFQHHNVITTTVGDPDFLMGSLLSGPGSEGGLCTASGISAAVNVMSNIISSALVLRGTHLKLVSNPAEEASIW